MKKIDFFGLLVAMIAGIASLFFFPLEQIIACSLVIWQLVSVCIHKCFLCNMITSKKREVYQKGLIAVTLLGMFEMAFELNGIIGWLWVISTFTITYWYLKISFLELRIWQHRELIHLK